MTDNQNPITNPLQNNNAAMAVIGYIAGIVAVKFPIFDLATWNYIFMSVGGVIFLGGSLLLNRKSAVVSTAANIPEVRKEGGIILDKNNPNSAALAAATPDNVVVK